MNRCAMLIAVAEIKYGNNIDQYELIPKQMTAPTLTGDIKRQDILGGIIHDYFRVA